ncbi:sigma-70 family RNA polymerase sigma factor [Neogemmobacter tilapiae]|uniref:RNA polymerase sigma factor n=1 Tax=Neogemmobacter tilapiae TaxID=875041 RepID=A0A918WGV6_9RHOB|nr:sigma-70 family RNA polymerase sigma factor [Gemmobacter tilapiae]GHC45507.1 RNA polymerase sigma factor [Gemmobacter tilapiae]
MDDAFAPLLAKVAAQDRAAFRELYKTASSKLFGVLMRMLGNRTECEDALQEVFTRIWLRAERYDPSKGSAIGWMIAITRNHAIDRLRARPVESADEDAVLMMADQKPGAEAGLMAKGEAQRIVDCMSQLEGDKARAVQGAYLNGLSYQQLADRFSVPLNTMRTWLRRSLLALRECMEK